MEEVCTYHLPPGKTAFKALVSLDPKISDIEVVRISVSPYFNFSEETNVITEVFGYSLNLGWCVIGAFKISEEEAKISALKRRDELKQILRGTIYEGA